MRSRRGKSSGKYQAHSPDRGERSPGRNATGIGTRGSAAAGIREQRKGLVLGNRTRRRTVIHQRQRGAGTWTRTGRSDWTAIHGPHLDRNRRRKRNVGADPRLLSLLARRVPGPHRPCQNEERNLVVDHRTAGPRRRRALLRLPRLRLGPHQDAPVGSRARSARETGFADGTRQSRSAAARARRCLGWRRAQEAPLLGLPARPGSLQSRERYARSPGRRHAASARFAQAARRDWRSRAGGAPRRRRVRSGASGDIFERRFVAPCARHHRQPLAALHHQRNGRLDRCVGWHRHIRL